jgi:S-adenosylmethionine:tRNA ribosyltransferase-isomerase
MKLTKFKIDIPEELIAQYPAPERDESRLMVVDRNTGEIEHKMFKDVVNYFGEGDVMIMNDSKVFPARLYGNKEKTGARIEVFLLRELNRESRLWDVLVDPARKIRIGNKLYFGENDELVAEVIDNTTSRGRTLRFLFDGSYEEFKKIVYTLGETPTPDYITRPVEPLDEERYQTIFAKHEGAVAPSSAGLHFSRNLMKRLELEGVDYAYLTTHTSLGSFRQVEVEDLTKHKMDSEQLIISDATAERVNQAKRNGNRVCAIGTSVLRSIESSVSTDGYLKPYDAWSNKFLFPPHEFSVADSLITNFHNSHSTLLMAVAAFGDYDHVRHAYDVAIKEKYRFMAYGDAMLIK